MALARDLLVFCFDLVFERANFILHRTDFEALQAGAVLLLSCRLDRT